MSSSSSFPTSSSVGVSAPEPVPPSPWGIIAIGAGSVLSSLDLFIVNLAFPAIRDSFPGANNQAMSWVLSAYAIAFAALLVPGGRLADVFGRRQVFRWGLGIFSLGSLACALAPDVLSLVIARGVKGMGSALMIPTSLGLLLAAYPKTRHKQVIGIWAATGSVAAALGPVLGGALVHLDWRWIFLVNLPVALPAIWLTRYLAETPRTGQGFPDALGSLLLISTVACSVAAISYAPDWGLRSLALWLCVGAAVLSLALFVARCLTVPVPALDLRVFKVTAFAVATLGMACFYMGFAIMLLGGSLYLTQVWKWDPVMAGMAFGLGPGAAVVASIVAGKTSIEPRRLTMGAGLLFAVAGLWWWFALGSTAHFVWGFLPGLVLTGVGAGTGQTGFIAGGTSALPAQLYATGSGIINTARQIGAAVGVSVFVAVAGAASEPAHFSVAWLLMGAFGLLASMSAFLLRAARPRGGNAG